MQENEWLSPSERKQNTEINPRQSAKTIICDVRQKEFLEPRERPSAAHSRGACFNFFKKRLSLIKIHPGPPKPPHHPGLVSNYWARTDSSRGRRSLRQEHFSKCVEKSKVSLRKIVEKTRINMFSKSHFFVSLGPLNQISLMNRRTAERTGSISAQTGGSDDVHHTQRQGEH